MKKLMLFINGQLGINILKHVILDSDTQIAAIIINRKDKRTQDYQSQIAEALSRSSGSAMIFEFSKDLWGQDNFKKTLAESNLGVSALFGHLIPESVINYFDGSLINLHPSLLPLSQGADPIAWSIIEDSPQGVSLHLVDKGIDTGQVVSQIAIPYSFASTSGELYEQAMEQLFILFVQFYANPRQLNPLQVSNGAGTFHRTSELNEIRANLLLGDPNVERTLRIIQALSFNDGRGARIKLRNGEIWMVKLSATREMDKQSHA